MLSDGSIGLYLGAVALGAVHGIEPGHGWPVAATYALDRSHQWLSGLVASLLIGVGHLISSIAMVAAFFYAKAYFQLTEVNEPLGIGAIQIGGPVSIVAGVVLILLGIREYRHGHSHAHHGPPTDDDHSPAHEHHHPTDEPDHDHQSTPTEGLWLRVWRWLPVDRPYDDDPHHHADDRDVAADRGLWGIAWFAFLLGFAHEEEFEIIALCAGSELCLELMTAYALTVIAGIVGLTLVLIAGYQQFETRVEAYTDYLPMVSAAVLILMGTGFVLGLF